MPDDHLEPVLEIVTTLARKAAEGGYIFRGETQCYPEVSSSLYRELPDFLRGQVEAVQEARLLEAIRFTAERHEFEILTELQLQLDILTELQHYGGKTNLIDFTTDCFIALFFACDGNHSQAGRVILLKRSAAREIYIHEPSRPVNRVIAQKSIFVRPPSGIVEPDTVICIPARLKALLLSYLWKCHGIAAETIYNDLHGYIRYEAIHQEAFATFNAAQALMESGDYQGAIGGFNQALALNPQLIEAYNGRGEAYGNLGELDLAITDFDYAIALDPDYAVGYGNRGFTYVLKGELDRAIQDFTQAIDLNPQDALVYSNSGLAYLRKGEYDRAVQDFASAIEQARDYAVAYCNRGEAWLHLGEWGNAEADLTAAKSMGYDIAASFHEDYESVAAFEQQHGIEVPPDLAEMLGG